LTWRGCSSEWECALLVFSRFVNMQMIVLFGQHQPVTSTLQYLPELQPVQMERLPLLDLLPSRSVQVYPVLPPESTPA
jgi:hypothetical protein